MDNTFERKIDLVYCWVDGSDTEWQRKRNNCLSQCNEKISNATCRFRNNDELKYSLRSVEKYAPWINHIYIITDNQTPKWLNTDNPKITVVDHKDILPSEVLPSYNSLAIEYCMHKIPDLSEYFLYANDDMFFANPVSPDFFYTNKGVPIFRFRHKVSKEPDSQYKTTIYNAIKLLKSHNYKVKEFISHHNIDAYTKSLIQNCHKEFFSEIDNTIHNKFRTSKDIQRIMYSYYAIASGQGIYKKVTKFDRNYSIFKQLFDRLFCKYNQDSIQFCCESANILSKINKYNVKLICINDTNKTTDKDRENLKTFLESYYGKKSEFEK